ncbi:MAG TPA: HAD family hydrolase, partial [Chitinophagaceae bacterium]|nr:HAD family hydrolase [Chitinophagaceae bacterium]
MKKRIAFFDFDGTITTRDTLLEVIKFYKGNFKFYFGFIVNAPFLIAYKAGIISNQSAKERVLKYFFGGIKQESFQQRCNEFSASHIAQLIRPKALHEIEKLKGAGAEVVIVSASAENWIAAWC